MHFACIFRYDGAMAIVQVRGVPEAVVRRLKSKAAASGQSLSEYLRAELAELASKPTLDEIVDAVARLEPVPSRESAAETIRRERRVRERRLAR